MSASVFKGSPAHVSALAGPATESRYPASYAAAIGGRGRRNSRGVPVAFRLPAFASWASCSRRGFPLSSRSAYRANARTPAGVSTFRTFETRPDWAPSFPRAPAVLSRPVRSLRPPLAPSTRSQALSLRYSSHLPELSLTGRRQGFTRVRPPGLPPSLVDPRMEQRPLGLLPGLRTPTGRTCGARRSGGRASSTRPELHDRHRRTSHPCTHSQCATSCRTIGTDMTRFPSAAHLASWTGLCPGNHESAGKRPSGRARKGDTALRTAMVEAAWAATRTRSTYLGAQYQRFRRRFGSRGETKAIGRSILVIIWALLSDTDAQFIDLGADYYAT